MECVLNEVYRKNSLGQNDLRCCENETKMKILNNVKNQNIPRVLQKKLEYMTDKHTTELLMLPLCQSNQRNQ